MHKFDVSNRKKLDSEQRKQLMPPAETLARLGLKEGMTFADVGCGTGFFTIPASRIAGGTVYALDVSETMLEDVRQKAEAEGIQNIVMIQTGEYDFTLEDNCADFVLVCNVLHEIDCKDLFFAELLRILKDGGRLAVIEWAETPGNFGPSIEHRVTTDAVLKMAEKGGLKELFRIDIGGELYGLVIGN